MLKTVTLRDDAYEVATSIARSKNKSLGDFLSDLVLREAAHPGGTNEISINSYGLPTVQGDRPLAPDMVKALLEEDED